MFQSFAFRGFRFAAAVMATLAFVLLGALPRASAEGPARVNADIHVMHATQEPTGSIDPALASLHAQLTKPPLSAFNTYRLIGRTTLALETGKSSTYALANGRTLQLTYLDRTPDNRHHVSAAINQPSGNAYLKLLEVKAAPNETFFVGGQPYKGGNLVLAITMRP